MIKILRSSGLNEGDIIHTGDRLSEIICKDCQPPLIYLIKTEEIYEYVSESSLIITEYKSSNVLPLLKICFKAGDILVIDEEDIIKYSISDRTYMYFTRAFSKSEMSLPQFGIMTYRLDEIEEIRFATEEEIKLLENNDTIN